MMLKLSLTSVKKRWRDYLVLMMGLIIAVAIFYMFQTVSLNGEFVEGNMPSVIQMVGFVFQFGAVLLGIITVVYVLYANSFLLSMRKKEYGMYMLLGAKKRKISQMIAIETLLIGSMALVIGGILGTLLSVGIGGYLTQLIDLPSQSYKPFIPMALIVTVVFFVILFSITTAINILHFKRTRTLDLLYSEATSERVKKQPLMTAFKMVTAIILLAIGYYCMVKINKLYLAGVVIAIFTITPGTFLFFNALFPTIIGKLKNWEWYSKRKLKVFTLSQLSFKAVSLSRVLGLVAMLIALSLGAVTVGQSFSSFLGDILKTEPYDVVSYNPTPEIKKEMTKINDDKTFVYHVKRNNDKNYYNIEEFSGQPLIVSKVTTDSGIDFSQPNKEITEFKLNHNYDYSSEDDLDISQGFMSLSNKYGESQIGSHELLSAQDFENMSGDVNEVVAVIAKDFQSDLKPIKTIHELELARSENEFNAGAKITIYTEVNAMGSGFMFMGFFLGFAFLAMLASCLMFKILSSAYQDVARYDMLHKIGVRRSVLTTSICKEIFVVFGVPALLGLVHVLVGMQMFKVFFPNPYAYITVPFIMFGSIYLIYYVITVLLYKQIVLPKKKA